MLICGLQGPSLKGTLMSEPRFLLEPLRDAIFPTRERENGLCRGFFFEKAVFPFSRVGKIAGLTN